MCKSVLFARAQSAPASLTIVLVVAATSIAMGTALPAYGNGPVLWNKLGSSTEVLNSEYGPNLQFYTTGGYGGFVDVASNPAYAPGVFGNAMTIGAGDYYSQYREHTAVLNNLTQYINPDRGTIEVWYKQNENPVPYSHGVYRIFDGSYGLQSGMAFTSEYMGDQGRALLTFGLDFGAGTDTRLMYDLSSMNGQWIHLAGVWDRGGIGGTADKIRLYVNGQVAASATTAGWGNSVGPMADIGGGNDNNIANKFYMDNLKMFDYAVTDFGHRFQEDWLPEPCSAGLLLAGSWILMRPRRRAV